MKAVLATLLLTIIVSSYAVEAIQSENLRVLLAKRKPSKDKDSAKKKDKDKDKDKDNEAAAEKKREQQALKDFAAQEAARAKEKKKILNQAAKDSEEAIAEFNNANSEKAQITVFVNLWKDAKGPTILKALTTLVSSSKSTSSYYTELVAQSIQQATQKGYSYQVSSGLASGLTIIERESDAAPLLNALLVILRTRNKARRGSGCTYIKNLLQDAELTVIDTGYEREFIEVLDEPRYVPLMECYLDECRGIALACCKDPAAEDTGLCGCDKKETRTCDYNVFWRQPRTIWRCNGEACSTTKCLCPFIKPTKAVKLIRKDKGKKTKETKKASDDKETETKTVETKKSKSKKGSSTTEKTVTKTKVSKGSKPLKSGAKTRTKSSAKTQAKSSIRTRSGL